jgi:hypothetical protein
MWIEWAQDSVVPHFDIDFRRPSNSWPITTGIHSSEVTGNYHVFLQVHLAACLAGGPRAVLLLVLLLLLLLGWNC